MTTHVKTIAVIGLGYVGLPLAVEFGKSRPVIGFDINASRIDALRVGMTRRWRSPKTNWLQPISLHSPAIPLIWPLRQSIS